MGEQESRPTTYKREKLYEEVWADPVKVVAARYGVSDVALAKNCRRMGIPLPGRGYWAKKKAGVAPERPPLPELPAGIDSQVSVAPEGRRGSIVAPLRSKKAEATASKIHVAETLKRPHPLVVSGSELMKGRGPRNELVSCRDQPCLDIMVSRASLGRALRIMDALLKAMEEQGYVVEATKPRERVVYYGGPTVAPGITRVMVGEDWVHFALSEKRTTDMETKRGVGGYTWTQRAYVFTGALSLSLTNVYRIDVRKTWNDGKRQRLEDCLDDFMAYVPLVSEKLREKREEEERRERERVAAEKRRQEEEERRQVGERRIKDLLGRVERWKLSQDIRAYVNEAAWASGHTSDDLNWALRYADKLDPLVEIQGADDQTC